MKYLVANWKALKTPEELKEWLQKFAETYRPTDTLEIIVSPPDVGLGLTAEVVDDLQLTGFAVAGQDCSPFPSGGYTGTLPAAMLRRWASYVIVGHPDRRQYFRETEQDLMNKVEEAADAGLIPILCLKEEEINRLLYQLEDLDLPRLLVSLVPDRPMNFQVGETSKRIAHLAGKVATRSSKCRILYSGYCPEGALDDLLDIKDLSGLMFTEEALDPRPFQKIADRMASYR